MQDFLPQSHSVLHKSLIDSGKMKIEKVQVTGTGPCEVKKVVLNRQTLPQKVKYNYVLFLPLLSSAASFSSESSKRFCEDFSGERGDLDTLLCSGSSLDLQAQKPLI